MRRLLVAGLAALAVVLGLVTLSGTAFAGPLPCAPDAAGARLSGCGGDHQPTGGGLGVDLHADIAAGVLPTPDPTCTIDHNPRVPGCQNSGPIYGGPRGNHYPGNWGGPRIDGRYLWLDQNLSLDVCSDSTYGGWYNRYSTHRDGFLRLLGGNPNARWMQLHSSSCGNQVSVSNDGQCVTYRTDALRYGNDLNTNRRDWSGLRLQLLSSHRGWNGSDLNVLSLSERNNWNRYASLDRQRFDNYNRVYGQLRTVCSDPNPPVVIVQAPAAVTYAAPAAAVAPSGNDAASAPAPAATSGSIPSGSVNTGGKSVAFTLAHARAV